MATYRYVTGERRPVHPSITIERVMDAAQRDDNLGFCLACGEEAEGIEPDGGGRCEACGDVTVMGAENIVLMMF